MGLFGFLKSSNKDKNWETRLAEVKHTNDQKTLENILKNEKNDKIRLEIIKRINNSSLLEDISLNDPDLKIQNEANNRINDLAQNGCDNEVRIQAIEKVKDQTVLEKIALESSDYRNYQCVEAAIMQLNDESVIAKASKNQRKDFRRKIVDKINDEKVLVDFVKNEDTNYIIKAAFDKIDNEKLLIDAVKFSSDEFKQEVVDRIDDKESIEKIAKNSNDSNVLATCVRKINDENLLADIAKNNSNDIVRRNAIKKINDSSILWDIILNEPSHDIRKIAFSKTDKCTVFDEFIQNSNYCYTEDLKKIEKLNYSIKSIFDLGNHEVLIIDEKGNNYTSKEEYDRMIAEKENDIKDQTKIDKKASPWAKGNETGKYFSDDVIFVSENFKNHSSPIYAPENYCVAYAHLLNPMTDRPTEKVEYCMGKFSYVNTIIITDLTPTHAIFDWSGLKTIIFINCDFSKIDTQSNIFTGCNNLEIYCDESSMKTLKDYIPESEKFNINKI